MGQHQDMERAKQLAELGRWGDALSLSRRTHPRDMQAAGLRALWAMRLGDYEAVLDETELALAALLQRGIRHDAFLTRVLAGESPRALMRYATGEVARLKFLRRPIVLRWEALHRLKRRSEAGRWGELCRRLWPTRVSVWETSGNHALDDEAWEAARSCFARALALDPESVSGLSGTAIVLECEKRWEQALVLRRRVAEQERALEGEDPASLHRVLRYAANLARLERWAEAGPLIYTALSRGAYAKLPQERAMLRRVLEGPLYAPLLAVEVLKEAGRTELPPRIARDVLILERLVAAFHLGDGTAPRGQLDAALVRAACAVLGGAFEGAYALLDELDMHRCADPMVDYLLWEAASWLDHPERPSIESFAVAHAREYLSQPPQAQADDAWCLAWLTLQRTGRGTLANGGDGGLAATLPAVCAAVQAGPSPAQALDRLAALVHPPERSSWTGLRGVGHGVCLYAAAQALGLTRGDAVRLALSALAAMACV